MVRNGLLLLHVAEECLASLGDKKSCYIRVSDVHSHLMQRIPAKISRSDYAAIYKCMKTLFPIYKNHRKRCKNFKVRNLEALALLDSNRLRLRPLGHLRSSNTDNQNDK